MTNGLCYIFGAGDFSGCSIEKTEQDIVIAADGGYDYIIQLGLTADMLLGDFDSLTETDLPADRIVYPSEKDDTDMLLAIKYGLDLGYTQFRIYGGLGGRLDHTIANIQALTFLNEHGATGILYGEQYAVTTVQNGSISLPAKEDGYISVFCLSDTAKSVTISGLKYPLQHSRLSRTFPLGVSNEFIGKPVHINVKKGTLGILWYL